MPHIRKFLLSLVCCCIPCRRATGHPNDAASVPLDEDVGNINGASRLEGHGIALRSRFEDQGDIADLNKAVEELQEALNINGPKHVSLAVLLADILRMRFEKSGDPQDLQRAIDILCDILAKCAPQSAECFSILNNLYLCKSLLVRQNTEHLQEARPIPNLSSFELPSSGSLDYPTASVDLAQAYMNNFYASSAQEDLRLAIEFYYGALEVSGTGMARASCLRGLGNAVFVHYEQSGEAEELQKSLEFYTQALEHANEGNLRIQCQIDLAGAYRARFYRDGGDADIQKSFNLLDDALSHCPSGHIHHPSILRSLCWSKLHRPGTSTIDDSLNLINSAKEALNLHPLHDTDRRNCLVLLAGVMYTHFQRVREVEYLNQRVKLLAEALSLCPNGHPDHGKACNGMADAFLERYEWADERDKADLDRAIQYDNLAAKTGSAPPWRYRPKALLFRYFSSKQEDDRNAAKDSLLQICSSPYYSYLSRIRMAMQWSSLTQNRGSRFADLTIIGYEIAIDLRTELASFSHQNAQTRIGNLAETGDRFAVRVAALALRASGPARAVELLEQSRAVFWTQALQLRSPFDGLPDDLQRDLHNTAQKLDAAPNDNSLTEKQVTERKNAALKFKSLLQQARSVPGFEGLLLPKSYGQLSVASTTGPVVILLRDHVAMDNCNVIIIRSPSSRPEHIELRGISTYKLKKGVENFNAARQARESETSSNPTSFTDEETPSNFDDSRMTVPAPWEEEYEGLLANLWLKIVKPIIDHLGFTRSTGRQRPRIHWCPTGEYAFLPLHAAGLCFMGSDSECALDYMVSSYTPTIAALLRARELSERITESTHITVLVVAQPTTPRFKPLPNTEKEIHALQSILPSDGLIRLRDDIHLTLSETNSNVTVAQVVEQLPEASIVHLACHGHQDQDLPLNSGFALEDGFLTIRKLFEIQPPRARLAFLSACSTAAGYENLPDEPIHLGATMLFAGFPHIIATLWTMGDRDGPDVARDVHTYLFDRSLQMWHLDGDGIAYALDGAVRNLINKGIHPSRWATYIHIGP